MFSISLGINRTVIVSSIKRVKEALVTKDLQFASRPQDIYTTRLISRENQSLGYANYEPYRKMLRKLTHSALKVYGAGKQKIAQMIMTEKKELKDNSKTYDGKTVDPKLEIGNSLLNMIYHTTFSHHFRRNDPEFIDVTDFQTLIFKGLAASDTAGHIPGLSVFPLKGMANIKNGIAKKIYEKQR